MQFLASQRAFEALLPLLRKSKTLESSSFFCFQKIVYGHFFSGGGGGAAGDEAGEGTAAGC
jgi:hypothetical protein